MPIITLKSETQAVGTTRVYEGRTSASTSVSSMAYGSDAYSTDRISVARYPVEYIEDRVLLDPDMMTPGATYAFRVGEDQFLAVKDDSGSINFYGFERKA